MQTLKEVTDSIDRQNKLQNMEEEIKNLRQQNAELVEALHEIWGWYPISITQPRKTIDDMREYAKTAIAKATGGE